MYLKVLKNLVGIIMKAFRTVFEKLWKLGEVHCLQIPLTGKDKYPYPSSKNGGGSARELMCLQSHLSPLEDYDDKIIFWT